MDCIVRFFPKLVSIALYILVVQSYGYLNITDELGPLLSSEAEIVFPGSVEFLVATDRDNEQDPPTFSVVVEVATESDVQETVRYANRHAIAFVATTGLHGGTTTLGKLQQGINIRMRKMNCTSIAADGYSATFGGGILGLEVKNDLWAVAKETVTGSCECVSLVGPLLGGRYGYLQGFYGLISDNLISARLVLGNGDAISVSAKENPDLFWALQGAGHNFGITTQVETRIYDVPSDNWAYAQFMFTHDKVEDVFAQLNNWTMDGTKHMPVEFINKNIFARIPPIDADNAVIICNIFYRGTSVVPARYTAPLLAIGPVTTAKNVTDYPGLAVIDGTNMDNTVCQQHDAANMMFPISVKSYNIQAQRTTFDTFNTFTADSTFSNSAVLFEAYSTEAVKSVKSESSAFPHRADNILITPVISYAVNKTLDDKSIEFGNGLRQALHAADRSTELHAYVNYAHGDETLQEVYGFEAWRLARLQTLKEKYDPMNRFGFYTPIHA
ncbi:FAD-dependent oxygenase [Seiridium cupressi]